MKTLLEWRDQMTTYKHFSFHERVFLEAWLNAGYSYADMSKMSKTNKSPEAFLKEVSRNKYLVPSLKKTKFNTCALKHECNVKKLCSAYFCSKKCKTCRNNCNKLCDHFKPVECEFMWKNHHVCNACNKINKCSRDKYFYDADMAHQMAKEKQLTATSHKRYSNNEIIELSTVLEEGFQRGLSISVIKNNNPNKVFYSVNHIYHLVKNNKLNVQANTKPKIKSDTDNRLNFRQNSKEKILHRRDYLSFLEAKPKFKSEVVQIDIVEGTIDSKPCLLSIFFTKTRLHVYKLMPEKTTKAVKKALDILEQQITVECLFKDLIPIILTDNGSEFNDFKTIEKSSVNITASGWFDTRTKLFYCPPYSSSSKGGIEKDHVELRKKLPKGTSFNNLSQKDIDIISSHVNSYKRQSKNFKSPYDVFASTYGSEVLNLIGIKRIPDKLVNMKPYIK